MQRCGNASGHAAATLRQHLRPRCGHAAATLAALYSAERHVPTRSSVGCATDGNTPSVQHKAGAGAPSGCIEAAARATASERNERLAKGSGYVSTSTPYSRPSTLELPPSTGASKVNRVQPGRVGRQRRRGRERLLHRREVVVERRHHLSRCAPAGPHPRRDRPPTRLVRRRAVGGIPPREPSAALRKGGCRRAPASRSIGRSRACA